MINTIGLKKRMKDLGVKQKDVAEKLKIAPPTVSQKINGVRPLTLIEAGQLAEILKIKDAEFTAYFFVDKVTQCNKCAS